jgi:hypothetical protein
MAAKDSGWSSFQATPGPWGHSPSRFNLGGRGEGIVEGSGTVEPVRSMRPRSLVQMPALSGAAATFAAAMQTASWNDGYSPGRGFRNQGRKAYDSFVFLVVWSLWLERNGRVRLGARPAASLVDAIFDQCVLWSRAGLVDRSQLFGS